MFELLETPIPTADPSDDELRLNLKAQEPNYRLARKNAKFFTLTSEQQRVVIAKDVLKQLSLHKMHPSPGAYVIGPPVRTESDRMNGDSCKVCALGALFACAVELHGGGKYKFWVPSRRIIAEYLEPYFSKDQLGLIESAFEVNASWGECTDDAQKAEDFGAQFGHKYNCKGYPRFDTATARMKAIMQNIIANNGTFVP